MSAANSTTDVDTKHNRKTPSQNDDNPLIRERRGSIICPNIRKQCEGGDTAITKEDQHHRTEKFADHLAIGASEGRGSAYSLTRH